MSGDRLNLGFLAAAHFLDHLFMLIFATVAALRLAHEWDMSYAALIPYATPGFVAFGVGAIVAGWLGDKWSRPGMITIFFFGIGVSSILTALADSPFEIALGLLAVGVFAAIYHPVGIAMVIQGRRKTGIPIAVNGVFGNLGVAAAALLTGYLIDTGGWRNAFVVPGAIAIVLGAAYAVLVWARQGSGAAAADSAGDAGAGKPTVDAPSIARSTFVRVLCIIVFTTAIGGLVFQSTTFALPKIFDERLGDLAGSATAVGGYAFLVFAIAAMAQLVVGYLVDRRSVRTVFAFVGGLQALFFALMYQLTGVAALVVSVAFMLVVFGQIPINDVLIGRITKSEWRSRVFALRYIVTFSVMASTLPVVAGIHAGWGFGALFVVMAVAGGGVLAAALMLPRAGVVVAQPATA
ncbi:MAG: MFS transporter [Deltaproteobacteria bacterium]|nr:MFS transporter [Deltaproteobacteria bacterium]